jgi:Ca2+-binding EF-hand superfamily protein
MSKILIVSATALLTLTTYANADDKRTDDKQASATFKAMDANRDDKLTQNEVSGDPTLAQNFTALDRDSDGYLSKKEYAAAASKDHMKDEKEPHPY